MARTYSSMMPLGTTAPEFRLVNTVDDSEVSLSDIAGEHATLMMFICNHCPFVKHLQTQIGQLSHFMEKGLGIAAISSNDIMNYPDDSPGKMKVFAQENDFRFPYLYDETQEIAKAYGATCTPDFFLFDRNLRCVYRGRYDESTPGNDAPINGSDLIPAIEATLANTPVSAEQFPSLGCNIKWKAS